MVVPFTDTGDSGRRPGLVWGSGQGVFFRKEFKVSEIGKRSCQGGSETMGLKLRTEFRSEP